MDNYQDDFKFHPVLSLARRAKPLASFPSSHFPYHAQPTEKPPHWNSNSDRNIFWLLFGILFGIFNHSYLSEGKVLRIIKYHDNNYQRTVKIYKHLRHVSTVI